MAVISAETIKELRERTGAGVMDCKKALEEAKGDTKKAIEILKQKGIEIAKKKEARPTGQGRIESYVHFGNKLAVLVEVLCETDFVASNQDFIDACKNIAMHIAAMNPQYLSREDIPKDILNEVDDLDEFAAENCLLDQLYYRDEKQTIREYLTDLVAKTGENIKIRRFVRYALGQ